MICRGCRLQVCQKPRHKRSRQNQWDWPCNDGLPESDLESSFQYCWWSPKVADGASWWLTASTPSHWWHCSFHILHSITLFPALDAEMCHFLFSNCIPHLQWVLVHFLDKTGYLIWFSCHSTSISCVHITTTTYEKFLGTARHKKIKDQKQAFLENMEDEVSPRSTVGERSMSGGLFSRSAIVYFALL